MTTEPLLALDAPSVEPVPVEHVFSPPVAVDLTLLGHIAERGYMGLDHVRRLMLVPDTRKHPPVFNATAVCHMAGISQKTMIDKLAKLKDLPPDPKTGAKELPEGRLINRARREFTLPEAVQWIQFYRRHKLRPLAAEMFTLTCSNFKGGSGKTTTTVCLAQALSLLGHKVLVIDLDPQGSCTNLFGIYPETEVTEEQTLSDFFFGHAKSIVPVIQKTYWHNIDLIPSGPALYSVDLALAAAQARGKVSRFWEILGHGLAEVKDHYDICLIDCSPSLSPLTINAVFAANGVIVPMPPSNLDFASSCQFFGLLAEATERINQSEGGPPKSFDFLNVLITKVHTNDTAAAPVRQWIRETFKGHVLDSEVPLTTVATVAAASFSTLYDLSSYIGSARTYARARETFDMVALEIEASVQHTWRQQVAQAAQLQQGAA